MMMGIVSFSDFADTKKIDINEFSIKRYIIDICRIKRYFPIPKY